jgi:ubiquitin-conjugating enzyme E2 Q
MGLKNFKSDVSTAAQKAAKGGFAGVIFVGHGESDGEVVIKYRDEALPGDVRIQALAQDVSEYPDGNVFMLWTDEPDPPPPVVAAIEAAQDYLLGMSVCEMVSEVATRVAKEIVRATKGGKGESQISDIEPDDANRDYDDDDNNEDDDDASDYDATYDEDFSSDGEEFGLPSLPGRRHSRQHLESAESQKPQLRRIKRDLRRVEQAGFKVGLLDGLGKTSTTGHVSISIRVDKLSLSNEAMEAWNLRPVEYVVLILRCERPYTTLERILQLAAVHTKVDFRIGRCSTYKPSLSQALVAFSESNCAVGTASSSSAAEGSEHGSGSFEKLFISNSLDQFLCESFVSLLKLRDNYGINWEQANEFLLSRIGLVAEEQRPAEPTGFGTSSPDPDASAERHPIQNQDHLLEKGSTSERSFPLVAMQFAMHYFVKCTKYCLRCHRRLEDGFEALRPYVCSDPLCLFQYMAMGFGPSIEHEILAEPYVVDLLVSFCYAAIQPYNSIYPGGVSGDLPIRTLPVGLRLRVPNLASEVSDFLKAKVNADNTQLVFEAEGAKAIGERLAPMKWLAFRSPGQSLALHARIHEVNSAAKTIRIEVMSRSAVTWGKQVYTPMLHPQPPDSVLSDEGIVEVFLYDTDFDSLDDSSKAVTMRHALDTLPPITQIQEWLISHPHSSFRSMEGISPAAASLLQWIVSSNRSCIFQVDRPQSPSREVNEDSGAVGGRNREHERILGMDGWVQFRFAQGSPDKELRFNRALQEVAARKGLQAHPTIFAWHGSNLANWHSIVRTGLDFKDIRCGRAYGNGVYFRSTPLARFSPQYH